MTMATVSRVSRILVRVGAIACLVGLSACGETYPPELKGPISGISHDCKTAGEAEPSPESFVGSVDLDGHDGKDYVIDYGKTCAAERALYCKATGCSLDVYVSAASYAKVGSFDATGWRVETGVEGSRLVLAQPGSTCGKSEGETCVETRIWRDGSLVSAP
jgi:hypothetical protein